MENITAIIEKEASKERKRAKRKAKEISQCDEELAHQELELEALQERMKTTKQKRQRLQAEKGQSLLVKNLKKKGAQAWKGLDNERKWQKATVLAVLCCDKDKSLPLSLRERHWNVNGGGVPEVLRQDRDVLLARLARKDFLADYSSLGLTLVFRLPPQFHGDKAVVLATLKQYPDILEQDVLTEEILDDRDVFLAFVHSEKLREQHFNLLSKFSERIRGNAVLMLEATNHLNAIVVLNYFTERLADNCKFARGVVATLEEQDHSAPPNERALGRFSDSVRCNKEIVLGLVRKNGRCLQDAGSSLKRDMEVVLAACKNNASALVFADCSTQRQLGQDRAFIKDIFSRWPKGTPGDQKLYRRLSKKLKLDLNIIIASHKDGNMSFADLPEGLRGVPDFWLDAIKRDSSIWRALPKDYENDPSFVHAIESFCDDELVAEVFSRFPFLADERDTWLAITSSPVDMRRVIGNHAPVQIRHDKELMTIACEKDRTVIGLLSEELQMDRTIVEAVVRGSGYFALRSIPHSTQSLYPDLVIQALDKCTAFWDRDDLLDNNGAVLAEPLWSNMEVVRAWFNNGGHFHSRFPISFKNNAEFGAILASFLGKSIDNSHEDDQDQTIMWANSLFRRTTSVELRENKEFMMEAVARCGCLFLEARGDLRRDVDLAIVAYSGDHDVVGFQFDLDGIVNVGDYNEDVRFVKTVHRTARSKLDEHKGFLEGFLPGMSPYSGNDCHLSMLAKGPETSLAFKKLIAEFVGIRTGQNLTQYRKAFANLSDSELPEPIHTCNCEHCDVW